jgi:probable rRNA maturation factor
MKQFLTSSFENDKFKEKIDEKKIIRWIKNILKELKKENKSVSIQFVSSKTIKNLNKKYRNKDYITDILSFSQLLGEKIDFINSNFLGDIVICVPYVAKFVKDEGHSMETEINYLLLHGILHLIGYDHENGNDDGKMMKLQNRIFKKLTGVDFE